MGWSFGPYEVGDPIGRGGMGEVFRAHDTRQRRDVALKLLPVALTHDDEFRERFRRESLIAARLTEPHVVPIHQSGEIDGRLYIDMRLVEGVDLGDVLGASGALHPVRAVEIVGQIAQALDAAHASGLTHRDVKPSNILITPNDFAYLVDFGIAHDSTYATSSRSLTATGATVGTLDYMAPERFTGAPADTRVDVYSLACVLFECLTGSRPFPVDGAPALLNAHLNMPVPQPRAVVPALPPAMDEVIARGMAKDPAQRFSSAGELAAAARAALAGQPVAAAPAMPAAAQQSTVIGAAAASPPQTRRTRPLLATPVLIAVIALLVVASATGVALAAGWGRSDPAPGAASPAGSSSAAPDSSRPPAPSTTRSTTPSTTAAPTTTRPPAPPPVVPAPGDLGVSRPITRPACDGRFAVFVGAAVDPATNRARVQELLTTFAGSEYLLSGNTCPSLRARDDSGNEIYGVYYGPFGSAEEACANRDSIGGDSYVKVLDTVTDPSVIIDC